MLDVGDDDGADVSGGLGTQWMHTDFDAETHELVVRAKLGPDNLAERFRIQLRDNDELEALDESAADAWLYEFFTEDFSEDELTEVRLSLEDLIGRQTPNDALFDGVRRGSGKRPTHRPATNREQL